MEDSSGKEKDPVVEGLEEKVAELERLSEELGRAPDAELSGLLERAVGLIDEVNAGIESRISTARAGSGEVEGLLDRVDFGAFDAALGSLEHESQRSGQQSEQQNERQSGAGETEEA